MAITVVNQTTPPKMVWMPIKPGATIYEGGLVCVDADALDEGIAMLPQASGISNTDNKDVPLGICKGTNRRTPVFNSTGQCQYITDEGATGLRASTTEYVNLGGEWPMGGKRAMALVQLIDQTSILRAPLFNAAVGTAPSVLTSTGGNANGLTVTTNATQFTPVENLCSIYARTGVNAGEYRQTDDTSTTVATWDVQLLNTTAGAGETYVRVPLRTHGLSYCQIGATYANYIDVSASPATNYFIIHVQRLNLSEAGEEVVDFRFDGDNFCTARA